MAGEQVSKILQIEGQYLHAPPGFWKECPPFFKSQEDLHSALGLPDEEKLD